MRAERVNNKGKMRRSLRSTWSRWALPLTSCCTRPAVKDSEFEGQFYLTEVGPRVPSHQRHPRSEFVPAAAGASGCTAEEEPEVLLSALLETQANLPAVVVAKQKRSGSDKATPCIEPEQGCLAACGCTPAAVTEPTTPVQLSPVPSRGLSQVSLATQDKAEPATPAGSAAEPAAEPVQSPAVSSTDITSSSSKNNSTTTSSSSSRSVECGRLACGMFTAQNTRQYQEDCATTAVLSSSEHGLAFKRVGVAAVFDGHGGSEASEHLHQHMVPRLLQQLKLGIGPQEATAAAVQQLEAQLMSNQCTAGSTLTAAIVLDDQLVVAQVGDSRAVLCRAEKAVQLTSEHKASGDSERARIAAADPSAEISSDGYCYGMGVSRGLGSYHIKSDCSKRAFTATADVTVHQVEAADDFIVLGSDGLFDSLRNGEVVSTARRALAAADGDCSAAAQALVDRAIVMGSSDNVTAVVMLLHGRKLLLAKSNSRLFKNRSPG